MQKLDRSRRYSWGRTADFDQHVEMLRAEFEGQPEICLAHAALIVRIRRGIDLQDSLDRFFLLWTSEGQELARLLSSRWLVSACDTIADHGTPFQRAGAMMLSATINTIKLAETERLLLCDASLDASKVEALKSHHAERIHVELWDGMTAYSIEAGDMPRNLLARMWAVLDQDRVLQAIGTTLIERALQGDTLFARLAAMNPRFAPPNAQ